MTVPTTTGERDPGRRIVEWVYTHSRIAIGALVGVALIAGSIWFVLEYQQRKEAAAAAALEGTRTATQAGNLPLAASDLLRLIDTYPGTQAADEAVVILAQVRLGQDQPSLAVAELERAVQAGLADQFRAPAYGLLANALEHVGSLAEAGEAFENAAGASWYEYLSAEYLNEAGRVYWTAGDTARAVSAYERVLSEFEDAPGATEARVRLAELRAAYSGAGP